MHVRRKKLKKISQPFFKMKKKLVGVKKSMRHGRSCKPRQI